MTTAHTTDRDAAGTEQEPGLLVAFPARSAAADGQERDLDHVALVTLNRPAVRNALDYALAADLADALDALDADGDCHCIVITGSGSKAFAAGADVRQLASETPVSLYDGPGLAAWERIRAVRTPTIAAVRGWALGAGCELAMMCDMILAAEDARFGQPELRLGIIPGLGGTQRLTRAIGKARAMEMVLTGRALTAAEAEASGLVTRVVPAEQVLALALELAEQIAAMPPIAARAAKEAVSRAFELPLSAGLDYERHLFYVLFGSADQREGMAAFLEKREPQWARR
jgi:enoyl-CoA hydratase